jgi:c-di-GMP-binding flagellar brake protein YcgR
MHDERRRYFRINEMIGLSIETLDETEIGARSEDLMELVSQQDEKIEQHLLRLEEEQPQLAELLSLINQKLERVSRALAMEKELVERIAHRVQEVSLSACGIAFHHSDPFSEGTHLQMEMTLFPGKQKVVTRGIVVSCELTADDDQLYYCRVDFYGMSARAQEELIQYIVQSQGQQLAAKLS